MQHDGVDRVVDRAHFDSQFGDLVRRRSSKLEEGVGWLGEAFDLEQKPMSDGDYAVVERHYSKGKYTKVQSLVSGKKLSALKDTLDELSGILPTPRRGLGIIGAHGPALGIVEARAPPRARSAEPSTPAPTIAAEREWRFSEWRKERAAAREAGRVRGVDEEYVP